MVRILCFNYLCILGRLLFHLRSRRQKISFFLLSIGRLWSRESINMKALFFSILLFRALSAVFGLGDTDSISDADPAQSGYLPNHNMDPAVVNSSAFRILWQNSFNANELASIETYSVRSLSLL